jgi:hypothetical protein
MSQRRQFTGRPDTTVVDAGLSSTRAYSDSTLDAIVQVDLGGRVLDCFATPGHHKAGSRSTTATPGSC